MILLVSHFFFSTFSTEVVQVEIENIQNLEAIAYEYLLETESYNGILEN